MVYFYAFAFIVIFLSLIATVTGIAKPNKITMCGYQIGMLLVVIENFIKTIQ